MFNKKAIPINKKTLYIQEEFKRPYFTGEFNERRTIKFSFGTISEPIKNVYKLQSRKEIEEIRRITRIFNINEEQKNKHKMLSIKNLATMKVVFSNN